MAQKKSTTLEEQKAAAALYLEKNKIANTSYEVTVSNTVGLIDKIGLQLCLAHSFVDKLEELDGPRLNMGKDIEEASLPQLVPAEDYDADAQALVPNQLVYMKPSYSKALDRKKWQVTIYNNDIEQACNDEAFMIDLASGKAATLNNSEKTWRYAVKRDLIGKMMAEIDSEMAPSTVFAKGTAYTIGTVVKSGTSGTIRNGIFVRDYTANSADDFADAIAKGFIVELKLTTKIAKPTDTATGEAFIKAVKDICEIAGDNTEMSLNGGAIGAEEGLTLYVPFGLKSVLSVDTMAGAFNKDELSMPVTIKSLPDFGSYSGKGFALLVDNRAIRLYNTYHAYRSGANERADFVNTVLHSEDTAWYSRNAFCHMFVIE